ncbi:hypothetical protein [Haloarcula amylovorans]|uniref:hypothetical protein n=1 Tax=Haloarcula amylovorans TaxID=2562280 RepID=UPI001FD7D373|nr:hypothetical protein [Halomicroarcula amylolytica]
MQEFQFERRVPLGRVDQRRPPLAERDLRLHRQERLERPQPLVAVELRWVAVGKRSLGVVQRVPALAAPRPVAGILPAAGFAFSHISGVGGRVPEGGG